MLGLQVELRGSTGSRVSARHLSGPRINEFFLASLFLGPLSAVHGVSWSGQNLIFDL